MSEQPASPSARQVELLEAAYRYALEHGLADLSLRPLAAAIGSSPRVLMFLFGNKDGLVKALLARARADELAVLDGLTDPAGREPGRQEPSGREPGGPESVDPKTADRELANPNSVAAPAGPESVGPQPAGPEPAADPEPAGLELVGLVSAAEQIWAWLREPRHRPLLRLWAEAYTRSLIEPDGAWAGFAASTVTDWLGLLASYQSPVERDTVDGAARRTAVLAVLRGCLLDLLATADQDRVDAALRLQLGLISEAAESVAVSSEDTR